MVGSIPFRIKICGVRAAGDIHSAVQCGADAVGLNFYPPSVRYLPPQEGLDLAELARQVGVLPVGVYVNQSVAQLVEHARQLGLEWVQLHGDETESMARDIADQGLHVIRAVRLPTGPLGVEQIQSLVQPWRDAGCELLLDAEAGKAFGGQGHKLDWEAIGRWCQEDAGSNASAPPLPADSAMPDQPSAGVYALAGGLTAENVHNAIVAAAAWAVDVASGVEEPRGTKSAVRIDQFCSEARRGFAEAVNLNKK